MSDVSPEVQALEKLIAAATTRTYEVDGQPRTFTIRQIKTGRIPKLLRASGSLIPMLTDKRVELDLAQLLLLHSEECLNMLAVMLDVERSQVDDLELDQSVELLSICLEVNIDFFVQKVLPLLSGGLVKLGKDVEAKREVLQKSLGPMLHST